MTEAEQEAFIAAIQQRRLASVKAHELAVAAKQHAKDLRTIAKLDQASAMMQKELIALDKAMGKVEKRAAMLTALRLLMENQA